MLSQFSAVFVLVSFISSSFSKEDFYGDNVDHKTFKHPNSTLVVHMPSKEIQLDRYYSPTELRSLLLNLAEKYDYIFELKDLTKPAYSSTGKFGRVDTIQQQEMWAVRLSSQVYKERPLLRPMFKFVANVNGDDGVGYALMVSLIQYLTYHYGVNPRITRMLNNTDIWIVPNSNVVDYERYSEGYCGYTADNGFPINKNQMNPNTDFTMDRIYRAGGNRYVEYLSEFITENPFVLSGNIQGGAIVANYPFDWSPEEDEVRDVSSRTSDDDVFKMLAHDYADGNSMMKPGISCNNDFPGGITNGDDWQKRSGSMQDFNYLHSNCFEITLFLSCCKYPLAKFLPIYWEANLESMLGFIESTRRGIYGQVTDFSRNRVLEAVVKVHGSAKAIKVTERGEYWRLLVPGSYNVTVSGLLFEEKQQEVHLNKSHPYVRLDFKVFQRGIYGLVTDSAGYPIKGAVVKIIRTDLKKSTEEKMSVDKEGNYYYSKSSAGTYEVIASAPGSESQRRTVALSISGPYVEVIFRLGKSICRTLRDKMRSSSEQTIRSDQTRLIHGTDTIFG